MAYSTLSAGALLLFLSATISCGSVSSANPDGSPDAPSADGPKTGDALGHDGLAEAHPDGTGTADTRLDASGADAKREVGLDSVDPACRQASVALGAAKGFAVLAASTVTNAGLTSVVGDVGVSPGTAITGFPPGGVVGTSHAGDPAAAAGIAALGVAADDVAARALCVTIIAGNLGGQTLRPGLYRSTSSLEISSGDLTLDAQGDAQAVFIFQMASTLTTSNGRQVVLSGGANAANVFWQVGTSATFGTTSVLQGTVMARQAITFMTGATVRGRLLAQNAAVTLDSNTIVLPAP